jgi:hypothetical protein
MAGKPKKVWKNRAVMLIPLCGRSICIYPLENKEMQIPRYARNDRASRFFHAFKGFPQIRRPSRFLPDFDATLARAQCK